MDHRKRSLVAAPVVAGCAFAAFATVTIGTSWRLGLWLVAGLGGALLGSIATLIAVGLRSRPAQLETNSEWSEPPRPLRVETRTPASGQAA